MVALEEHALAAREVRDGAPISWSRTKHQLHGYQMQGAGIELMHEEGREVGMKFQEFYYDFMHSKRKES